MPSQTFKSSLVIVASGRKTRFYRSLEAVPAETRRKVRECTTGKNAATLLIADQRGREEIARVMRGLPSGLPRRPGTPRQVATRPVARIRRRLALDRQQWLLVAAFCSVLALLASLLIRP